jgi:hypothetical protein
MPYGCRWPLSSRAALRPGRALRRWLAAAVLAAAALLVAPLPAHASGDIAVVVNPDVKVESVTFTELRKILLGNRQFWPSGQPVTLIVRAPVAAERTFLLKKVYDMSEAQYRQYWIAKVFRAEATSGPRVVVSNVESVELVSVLSGAIVLMDASDVPAGLKVLQVDGLLPGSKNYALKQVAVAAAE